MYADAVATLTDSIFPLFVARPDGDGVRVEVTGTGFFVDGSGLFLTADDVVAGGPDSAVYYYGKVPDQACAPVEIECVARDPARNLYLGRVARNFLAPAELSSEAVRLGDSVCLSGYPMAAIATSSRGSMVGNIRRYWQPTFVIDDAEVAIGGRTYAGFMVQDAILRGMSGGPVFDVAGRVRGMAAATLTRTIPDAGGTPTVVKNGIVVNVEQIHGFLAEHAPGFSRRP